MLRSVIVVEGICNLPRFLFCGENVDFGVFARECVVLVLRSVMEHWVKGNEHSRIQEEGQHLLCDCVN